MQKWFACVANAQFMLNDVQNESFAEQLREKTRYYREKGQELDYFLVCEPEWLDKQHPEAAQKVQRPCVALVGQEESWIRCAPRCFASAGGSVRSLCCRRSSFRNLPHARAPLRLWARAWHVCATLVMFGDSGRCTAPHSA